MNTEYHSYRIPLSFGFLSDFGRDRLISLPRVRLKSKARARRKKTTQTDGSGMGRRTEMFLPRLIRGLGAESEFFSVDANFLSLWHQPHSLTPDD